MKNLIIVLSIMAAGFLASCTKDNSVKPTNTAIKVYDSQDPKNLGSGDGAPPTPGH
jgi:hypothetical protein